MASPRCSAGRCSIRIELAAPEDPEDDAGLCRLLRENPIPGRIALSYEREPRYFGAAALEGPFHQTLVARAAGTGEIVGCASRAVRTLWVNGAPQAVGYMSQLRFHPRVRQGMSIARCLARSFNLYRSLHEDGRAPFYLLSIVAENRPAQRLLASGLPGFPRLHPYARLSTYAIPIGRPRRPRPLPAGLRLTRGSAALLPAILDCLARNGARHQLAPVWTAESLCQPGATPGLAPEDFFVVLSEEGKVVGCLAGWDQGAVKQTVVRGYSGALARWRRLLNLMAPFCGWPELPEPGTALRSRYASHRAIDEDEDAGGDSRGAAVFAALLRALYNQGVERGDRYLVLGLGEGDPLDAALRSYRSLAYASQLYLAAWEDGEAAVAALDGRIPGPEVAVL